MADELTQGLQALNPLAGGNIGQFNVILYGLLLICLIGLVMLVINILSFKNVAVIRQLTGGRKIVRMDKFKEKVDSNGVTWWVFLKEKKRRVPAPPECVDITRNGVMFVEFYKTEDGTLIAAKDHTSKDALTSDAVDMLSPVNTAQRIATVDQMMKAEARRQQGFLAKFGAVIIPAAFIIIIVVLLFSYWGNIVEPAGKVSVQLQETSKSLAETTKELSALNSCHVTLQPADKPSEVPK